MPSSKSDDTPAIKAVKLYHLLLYSGRPHSLSQLAQQFQCAKSTILRHIEALERAFPNNITKTTQGGQAFFRFNAPESVPQASLDLNELRALSLCRQIGDAVLPQPIKNKIESTVLKTATLLKNYSERDEAIASISIPRIKGRIDYTPYAEIIQKIIQSIDNKKICEVIYNSYNSQKTIYVGFMRIVSFHDALYAEGYLTQDRAPEQGCETTFAIHRIEDITPLHLGHTFDPISMPSEYFGFMEGEPFSAKIRFSPPVTRYIQERQWSSQQKIQRHRDGSATLTFTAQSLYEVVSWVLSFGDKAMVISPKYLKKTVAKEVESLAGKYSTVHQ